MESKQIANVKAYKELIETVAKVEYQKLCAAHLIEYLELVNIGTQTLYNLFKNTAPENFNTTYLSTAIRWAIRNEVRRRYRWYTLKKKQSQEEHEDLREAVYKTILSIEEIADSEHSAQIKDGGRSPEESMEFFELKDEILQAIKKLPQREKDLIESKFFKDKKLREISIEFDLSPSRVSRIIQSGLNKIKKELKNQKVV